MPGKEIDVEDNKLLNHFVDIAATILRNNKGYKAIDAVREALYGVGFPTQGMKDAYETRMLSALGKRKPRRIVKKAPSLRDASRSDYHHRKKLGDDYS